MASLTIKNIPPELLERLKGSAAARRRSLNREVIQRLEDSLGSTALDVDALLREATAVRERPRLPYLTDQELKKARERGRA